MKEKKFWIVPTIFVRFLPLLLMITVVSSLTGSKLFNDFLTRQLAQENLAFYIAVERYV